MKEIITSLSDEEKKFFTDQNEDYFNDHIIDDDTYFYFANEVCWKEYKEYAKNKHKAKFKDKKNNESFFYNQELIIKYAPKYSKIRDKFYLYKGNIYSYVFVGDITTLIKLYKYDMSDLLIICNHFGKKVFSRKIMETSSPG